MKIRMLIPVKTRRLSLAPLAYAKLAGACAISTVSFAMTAHATYTEVVLADNPVGYYEFNETSGMTAANSGSASGLNITAGGTSFLGSSTAGPRPPEFPGFSVSNTGAYLSGATFNSISASNFYSAVGGSSALTLEMWVNADALSGSYQQLFNSTTSTGNNGMGLLISSNGIQMTGRSQTSDSFQSKDFSIDLSSSVGEWIYVAAVYDYDASTFTAYVNGTSLGTQSVVFTSTVLNFGTPSSSPSVASSSFVGDIDSFAIYSSGLTDADILAHYNAAISVPEPATTPLILVLLATLIYVRHRKLIAQA